MRVGWAGVQCGVPWRGLVWVEIGCGGRGGVGWMR